MSTCSMYYYPWILDIDPLIIAECCPQTVRQSRYEYALPDLALLPYHLDVEFTRGAAEKSTELGEIVLPRNRSF